MISWNQKFLDYEIETMNLADLWMFSWNQKFLDYEIETNKLNCRFHRHVGIKSFSITRLKLKMITATTVNTIF